MRPRKPSPPSSPGPLPDSLSYQSRCQIPRSAKTARDRAQIEEKRAIVKAGISLEQIKGALIDSAPAFSVQQFVGIIAAPRLISGIANQRLNLLSDLS